MKLRGGTVWTALIAAVTIVLSLPAMAAAAPFTVDDLDDTDDADFNDGVCDAVGDDTCTLRAALVEAGATGGSDTITISIPGTIELANGLGMQDVTVNGHPAGTTIDRNDGGQVLSTTGTAVTLRDLTITGGRLDNQNGAGISSFSDSLTLDGVTVTSNEIVNSVFALGAGIRVIGDRSLVLTDSTISDNTISGTNGQGGGIRTDGPLSVSRSTISGNKAAEGGAGTGGGIAMGDGAGSSTFINSTISGNEAGTGGAGGFRTGGGHTTSVINVTFAGNSTTGFGGALAGFAPMTLENVLFGPNVAQGGTEGCSYGQFPSSIENTIDTGTSCLPEGEGNGNQGNVSLAALDLGALADNGGPTRTHAISATSVAKDAASADCGAQTVDQRRLARPQGPACDVGAYERLVPPPPRPPAPLTQPAPGGQTPECAELRAKLKKLNRKIKRANDREQKAKLKKKRRKARKRLAALAC